MEQLLTSCKYVYYFQLTSVTAIILYCLIQKIPCTVNVIGILNKHTSPFFSPWLECLVLSGQEVNAHSLLCFLAWYKKAHTVSLVFFASTEQRDTHSSLPFVQCFCFFTKCVNAVWFCFVGFFFFPLDNGLQYCRQDFVFSTK